MLPVAFLTFWGCCCLLASEVGAIVGDGFVPIRSADEAEPDQNGRT